MKKTIKPFSARAAMMLLSTLLLTLTAQTAWAQTPASIGSIQYSSALSAYEIKSVDNLNDLAVYVNGSGTYSIGGDESTAHNCSGLSFKMTDDITYTHTTDWNASETENNYTPIGTYDNKFMGTFDGQGHTISGIRIVKKNNDEKGLFGRIYGATVMNITLTDTRIAGYNNVGGIAGYTEGYTTPSTIIRNCHVADNVSIAAGNMHSGGIVGSLGGYSSLSGCTSAATVSGNSAVGGIAGYTNGGSISECLVLGATVSGTSNVGAIIGQNNSGTLSNDYYTSSTKVNGAAPSGTGQVRSITAGANVILDYAVSANTQLDFNGIAFYNSIGMKYANALYTYNNNAVNLSLSYNHTGYTVTGYSASAGTFSGSAITGSNDAYTLTANADVVINATETANTYSVVFNGNGSTSGSMDNESFTYDEAAKALTANAFIRTGYTFAGWATSAEGAVIYADQAEVQNLTATANGIFDLYAKWTENVATLTEANPIAPLTAWSGQQTKVNFTRSGLTAGAYSTICLPYNFTASETCTFYTFVGVKKEGDDWVADISAHTGTLAANTPYIFTTATATSVTFFNDAVTAAASYDDASANTSVTDWTFQGTYSQISLPKTDEYDYGFAAGSNSNVQIGSFVHLKSGASAAPFRAYLKYTGSDDNWAKAPNRAGAANDAMPSRIIVRIVGADGGTTDIGTLDTRTGEIIPTDGWFDLNGRRLQGKPSTKGVYINNGKKVAIK